jgi:hypothetical protein
MVVQEVLSSLLLHPWFGGSWDINECYLLMMVNVNFVVKLLCCWLELL